MATATAKRRVAKEGTASRQGGKKRRETAPPIRIETGKIWEMPISEIKGYDNPRHEPAKLYEMGYVLFGDPTVTDPDPEKGQFVSLSHLALSDNPQQLQWVVELFRKHEVVDRKADPAADQSICELAEDIQTFGQLVPIHITQSDRMGDGGRRVSAILLLHAESKLKILQKAEDAPKQAYPATVNATDLKCKPEDLYRLSVHINLARKNFTELQEGRVYHDMIQQTNPATGNRYTMKEAAQELHVHYQTFRNREALWRPHNPRTGRGLTDEDRKAVAEGRLTVTAAVRRSLGEQHYSVTGAPSHKRNRGVPLSEMQKFFDETPANNSERRQAIADCMGLPLSQALKESLARQEAQAEKMERQSEKAA